SGTGRWRFIVRGLREKKVHHARLQFTEMIVDSVGVRTRIDYACQTRLQSVGHGQIPALTDLVIRATAGGIDALTVIDLLRAIETDADGDLQIAKQAAPLVRQQCSIS